METSVTATSSLIIIIIIIIILTEIQDQVVLARNYKEYILKQPDTDELCRRCGKESETIQHITAACEQLAPTEYVKRHDGLTKIIHQKLAEAAKLIDDKVHIKSTHHPMYWRMKISSCTGIAAYKTIPFNRPDITFMNKKTKNTFLRDIALQNTHNFAKTITNKQNKYQELANEICAMWKQKAARVILIVISSMEVIPKSLSQSLTRLNLHLNTYIQLQKSISVDKILFISLLEICHTSAPYIKIL